MNGSDVNAVRRAGRLRCWSTPARSRPPTARSSTATCRTPTASRWPTLHPAPDPRPRPPRRRRPRRPRRTTTTRPRRPLARAATVTAPGLAHPSTGSLPAGSSPVLVVTALGSSGSPLRRRGAGLPQAADHRGRRQRERQRYRVDQRAAAFHHGRCGSRGGGVPDAGRPARRRSRRDHRSQRGPVAIVAATSQYYFGHTAHYVGRPSRSPRPGRSAPARRRRQRHRARQRLRSRARRTGLPGLSPATGGGTASVGGIPLSKSYQCFVADASGRVAIDYVTPACCRHGHRRPDRARHPEQALYNAKSLHGYSFGEVRRRRCRRARSPAAAPAGGGKTVTITLTPRRRHRRTGRGGDGAPVAAAVQRRHRDRQNYAVADAGTTLDGTPRTFVTHTQTKLQITYRTPVVRAGSGTDTDRRHGDVGVRDDDHDHGVLQLLRRPCWAGEGEAPLRRRRA